MRLIVDIKIPNMLKAPNYQIEESSGYYLPTTNLSSQIVTIGQSKFLIISAGGVGGGGGFGHSVVTKQLFIAGTTNPDW